MWTGYVNWRRSSEKQCACLKWAYQHIYQFRIFGLLSQKQSSPWEGTIFLYRSSKKRWKGYIQTCTIWGRKKQENEYSSEKIPGLIYCSATQMGGRGFVTLVVVRICAPFQGKENRESISNAIPRIKSPGSCEVRGAIFKLQCCQGLGGVGSLRTLTEHL